MDLNRPPSFASKLNFKRILLVATIITCCGIIAPVIVYFTLDYYHLIPHKPSTEKPIGVWCYDLYNQAPDDILVNLEDLDLDFIFLSVDSRAIDDRQEKFNESYMEKVLTFLSLCDKREISVHAMILEDPAFVDVQNHESALNSIDSILHFNENNDVRFKGVHIDTEPHVNIRWASASNWSQRNEVFQDWLSLLGKIRQYVDVNYFNTSDLDNKSGIDDFEFSAAIGHWYHDRSETGDLAGGSAAELHDFLDFIVPMVYDGIGRTAAEIIDAVEPEMSQAPVVIGVGGSEFESNEDMMDVLDTVTAYFESNANFLGTCIFHAGLI
ncbi:MAG: hypothetical protein ACTSRA_21990 [Promethearchaeota archaeon]